MSTDEEYQPLISLKSHPDEDLTDFKTDISTGYSSAHSNHSMPGYMRHKTQKNIINGDQTENDFIQSTSSIHECYLLFKTTIPIVFSLFCDWCPQLISLIFIGHTTEDASTNLAIVGLSKTFYFIIEFIMLGFLSALYVLIPHAFSLNNKDLLLTYVNRSFVITMLVSLPFVLILSYAGTIMVYIGIALSEYETEINLVCTQLIANLYIFLWLSIVQRIAESVGLETCSFISGITSALFSFLFAWLFISYLNLTYNGFAITLIACNFICLLVMTISLIVNGYGYIFRPQSLSKIFNRKGIKTYLFSSLSGVISFFELCTSEIVILLSAFIVIDTVSAVCCAVIIMSILTFLQFFATGMSYALSWRIENYKVFGYENKAKQSKNVGYCMILVFGIVCILVLFSLKERIIGIFISNTNVISYTIPILYILMAHQLIMLFEYALSGVFRGIGLPQIPVTIILISYYLVPFPMMFILLFAVGYNGSITLGLMSIFACFLSSKIICVIVMQMYLSIKVDWESIFIEQSRFGLVQEL